MVGMALKKTATATPPPLNRTLLPAGSRICVAVSGGADSTALLLLLHEQASELGLGLSAAHLHHGIRGAEADRDRDFVRDLCKRLDLPLFEQQADIPSVAEADGETIEAAARNARLRFFAALLADHRADAVATAHTADDQAETVMLKLIRGAWTEGLGGISPVLYLDTAGKPTPDGSAEPAGVRIIRPLLNASREQVVSFLQSRGQPWQQDETNDSDAYSRNRIRSQLMPVLREFNPSIAVTLGVIAELAREEEARWTGETARLYHQLATPGRPVRGGGRAVSTSSEEQTVAFELERLRGLDLPSRRRLLRLAAVRMGVRLNASETLRLLLLAGLAPPGTPADRTVPSKPNSRLALRDGLRAERSVREFRLSRLH